MTTYSATAQTGDLEITVSISPRMDYPDSPELSELAQMGLVQTLRLCQRNRVPSPLHPKEEAPF